MIDSTISPFLSTYFFSVWYDKKGSTHEPSDGSSKQPSMVSGAMHIYTDPCYSRAMDPDMAVGSSSGLDDIMDPGGSTGPLRSAWPLQQPDPQSPTWLQVSAQTLGLGRASMTTRAISIRVASQQGHRHGPQQQFRPRWRYRPLTSAWHLWVYNPWTPI